MLNAINLIYKEQTPLEDNYSESPLHVISYSAKKQRAIADEFLAGGISYFDLAINYQVKVLDVQKWVDARRNVKVKCEDFSKHKVQVLNLRNLCSNREIAARVGIPVRAVCMIIKNEKGLL